MIRKKVYYLLSILILLQLSCTNRNEAYWIIPENQNGQLHGFHASYEYCKLLLQNCNECHTLINLLKEQEKISLTLQESVIDSEMYDPLLKIIGQLDSVYDNTVLQCGGYCPYAPSLPVLPYRKIDLQYIWNESNVLTLQKFLQEDLLKARKRFDIPAKIDIVSISALACELQNSNTIEAMIIIKTIQLKLLGMTMAVKSKD